MPSNLQNAWGILVFTAYKGFLLQHGVRKKTRWFSFFVVIDDSYNENAKAVVRHTFRNAYHSHD